MGQEAEGGREAEFEAAQDTDTKDGSRKGFKSFNVVHVQPYYARDYARTEILTCSEPRIVKNAVLNRVVHTEYAG